MEEYKSHTIIAEAIHIYKQNLPAHQPLISSGKREFKKKKRKRQQHTYRIIITQTCMEKVTEDNIVVFFCNHFYVGTKQTNKQNASRKNI